MTAHRTRAAVVASIVALAGVASASAWVRMRHDTERRFASLSACLLGDDPLRPGELPSQRLLAIELARPAERMMPSRDWKSLVPEKPTPPDRLWPNRCAVYADEAARAFATRLVAPRTRERLGYVAAHLGDDHEPFNALALDALWVDAAPVMAKRAADASVERPWRPVELVASSPSADVASACRADRIFTGDDRYALDEVFVKGTPGCVVSSTPEKRLATLRLGEGREAERVSIPAGLEPLGNHSLCNGGDGYTLVVERGPAGAPDVLELRMLDSTGATEPARIPVAEPAFAGHAPETHTTRSRPTVSCRASEAHVAWAFSSAIDQRPTHEVFVASCTRSKNGAAPTCTVRSQTVHAETGSSSGCSLCLAKATPYEVGSPQVVDLFGATALFWLAGNTERARVAPLEKLDATPDTVLWHEPRETKGHFASAEPRLVSRAEVALTAIDFDAGPRVETRLFRIDAQGVSLLVPR